MVHVADALKNDTVRVKMLRLSNGLSFRGAKALRDALKVNRSLQVLQLNMGSMSSTSTLQAGCLALLTRSLVVNQTLQVLYLNHCEISTQEVRALAMVLGSGSSLQKLGINGNSHLGNESAAALATALVYGAKSLTKLSLHTSSIGNAGAASIGKALETNCTLNELNLGYSLIGDSGAIALAEGLADNASLKYLNLRGCKISNKGAAALARAIKKNTSLQILDLSSNQDIGAQGIEALANGLSCNSSLQQLLISESMSGSPEQLDRIKVCLAANQLLTRYLARDAAKRVISVTAWPCVYTKVAAHPPVMFELVRYNEVLFSS
jgi:Ran GTPase-activating protein (RanGAP) involved in mRNA processing and transport